MAHDHHHDNELEPMAARVRALETILTQKGLVETAALDAIVETYETKVGPRNGARVVAKAWSDAAYALRRHGFVSDADLAAAWRRAAHATPHGKPILLENAPQRDA